MSVQFDPRPLSEPVDRATARAFRAQLAASGRLPSGTNAARVVMIVILVVFGVIFVGGGIVTSLIAGALASMNSAGGPGAFLFPLVPLLLFAGIGVLIAFGIRAGRATQAATWYRLDRFARANGMTFEPVRLNPPLPGMIFSQGSSRSASDLVRGDSPRFVEFANYRYTTGSGKNQTTHKWGYVAVHLSSPLPHIVLDAVGNNGLFGSNLPVSFGRDQHLSLEGDFDRHFRLYCPSGYERDALYLFTPDIMARFVDHAAALDVEIVDDWLFFYGKRDFSTLDPATWAWLFGAVAAMIDKLAQWERWRDERLRTDAAASAPPFDAGSAALPPTLPVAPAPGAEPSPLPPPPGASALPVDPPAGLLRPPPGVAAPGRRLRRTVPWAAIVLIVVVVLFAVLGPLVSTIAGIFSTLR